MSLPAVLKTVGLVPGVVAIALVALITDITAGLLLRATDATDANTYGDTMRRAVGGWAATTLQVAVVVNNLGLNIVYLIIMGDCLAGANGDQGAIAGILGGESAPAWATDRVIIMGASCALILAPLCVVRSIVCRRSCNRGGEKECQPCKWDRTARRRPPRGCRTWICSL